jgi:hypothetical protein
VSPDDEQTDWKAQLEMAGLGCLATHLGSIYGLFVYDMNELIFVGTGFAGPPARELVTARHVAAELLATQNFAPWEPNMIALVPTASGLVPIDIVGFNMSHDNNVSSDLAVARLDSTQLEQNITLPRLVMQNERVEVGEVLVCVGFPNMAAKVDADSQTGAFEIEGKPQIVEAPVVEVCDFAPNIPAPAFKMEFEMAGGTSGGPIFRPNGEVVGICSYGNLDGPPWFCCGSTLRPLWEPYAEADQWLP